MTGHHTKNRYPKLRMTGHHTKNAIPNVIKCKKNVEKTQETLHFKAES